MCLGGHLAYRCALDHRVNAAVCYFATDIHSGSLGEGKHDDSLARAKDIKGELLMVCNPILFAWWTFQSIADASQIFGKRDTHVDPAGRDLIRKTLHKAGVTFSFFEAAWAQRTFDFVQRSDLDQRMLTKRHH